VRCVTSAWRVSCLLCCDVRTWRGSATIHDPVHMAGMMLTRHTPRRLLAWLPALSWAGFIFFLSAQPSEVFPKISLIEVLSVGAHLVSYAVLMALLVMALRRSTGLPAAHARLLAFVFVALYALSDEYHQSFVPGRTPTPLDWLVDLVGAALAWRVLLRRERR
jgi:VanZ family protein